MPTNRHISARHQCIKIASNDALSWAEQTRREVFNDMLRDGDGEWPDAEAYATRVEAYDCRDDGESAAFVSGVPDRWSRLYDTTLSRVYRRAIRRHAASIRAEE